VLDAQEEDRAQYRGDLAGLHEMTLLTTFRIVVVSAQSFKRILASSETEVSTETLNLLMTPTVSAMVGRSLAWLVSFLSDCCPKFPSQKLPPTHEIANPDYDNTKPHVRQSTPEVSEAGTMWLRGS